MATLVLNRRRASWPAFWAMAAAFLAGLAVYSYLSYLRSQIPQAGKLVPMVVAATDIEPGTALEPGMLEMVRHPSRYLPAGAIASREAAAGNVATVPVFKGEAVTSRKVGRRGGVSSVVPPGQRAYSLAVASGASLGFSPRPGDRVDVIVTLPQEVLGQATSQTVLRHKEVASVGSAPPAERQKTDGKFAISNSQDRKLGITLFVNPEEAQRLAMAEAMGKITVILAPQKPDLGKVPDPITPGQIRGP